LYDYRETAQFVINVDVEDLIIPKHFNSLPIELNYLANKFPDAASFEFLLADSMTHSRWFLIFITTLI
jgi:hypothetical protein